MERKVFRVVRKQEPYSLDESKPIHVRSSIIVRRSSNSVKRRKVSSERKHVVAGNNLEQKKSHVVRRSQTVQSTALKVLRVQPQKAGKERAMDHIIRFDQPKLSNSPNPSKPSKPNKPSKPSRPVKPMTRITVIRKKQTVAVHRPTIQKGATRVNSSQMNKNTNKNIQTTLKKALLIGINYLKTDFELNGCINDSQRLGHFLASKRYFRSTDMIMMNDELKEDRYPTKENILKQLNNLVNFARNNRNKSVDLFVSYSGHGYYLKDKNGDEIDGRDEVLCPVDCDTQGYITDDVLRSHFVDKLPRNVKLVMMIDACHSGTALDLRYSYKANSSPITMNNRITNTQCDVVMISGCRDSQTSADAYLANPDLNRYQYQGAMTASFLDNYRDNVTYDNLIRSMRKWLDENGFDQVPQLSSGKFINVKSPFLLSSYR